MKKNREFEPNPKTPLDNWDETIDPALMSGDHWVREENTPLEIEGIANSKECEAVEDKMRPPGSHFMHPTMNVSYENHSTKRTHSKIEKNEEKS